MDSENGRSMDMELEYEEEKEVIEIESDEEEEDEIEELEEMTLPRLSSWVGADGKKHQEIVVNIYDDLNGFKNRLDMIEPCPICYKHFSTQGNHRICGLPCGHLYGHSCIKKWLQTLSGEKCPQCNTSCAYKDVILLYTSRASAHQKTSSARHFPFTKQGLIEFKKHEKLRGVDAKKMHAEDHKRLIDVLEQMVPLETQLVDLSKHSEELEHDGFDVALKRYDTLRRRADVLEQRLDVLERWFSASKPTLKFFTRMYKKHLALQRKKTKACTGVLQTYLHNH